MFLDERHIRHTSENKRSWIGCSDELMDFLMFDGRGWREYPEVVPRKEHQNTTECRALTGGANHEPETDTDD